MADDTNHVQEKRVGAKNSVGYREDKSRTGRDAHRSCQDHQISEFQNQRGARGFED
jgi:hypothetical protein